MTAPRTIWKFPINVYDDRGMVTALPVVTMPAGAEILCLQLQDGNPMMWAVVDPDEPWVARHFAIVGTGTGVPDDVVRYVGTWQTEFARSPSLVFHVFEVAS